MKTTAIALTIMLGFCAGVAAGAEPSRESAAPNQDICLRRDITPEEYNQKCVIQNGPPHRHIIRNSKTQSSKFVAR